VTELFDAFPSLMGAIFIAVGLLFSEKFIFSFLRFFGVFTTVDEQQAKVYELFGNVIGVIDEPGFHFLWPRFGWRALIVNYVGTVYLRDKRLDQQYIRSTPVNSEEGAPMGVGVWYELMITDPVAHIYRNTDARGSLAANVSNATVKCLSNQKLEEMLENRHHMSQMVRKEVSILASEWGYALGSTYIRKVHFRDREMIHQIEEKVVNRLRQVTSAIRQDGTNQVNIITSSADAQAAVEFARAAARRPEIVGKVLADVGRDPVIADALFEILETQRLLQSKSDIILVPRDRGLLTPLLASSPPGSGSNLQ
jgi:regulator of protease activity HflC (stomatin/prohibitin superfamily)